MRLRRPIEAEQVSLLEWRYHRGMGSGALVDGPWTQTIAPSPVRVLKPFREVAFRQGKGTHRVWLRTL